MTGLAKGLGLALRSLLPSRGLSIFLWATYWKVSWRWPDLSCTDKSGFETVDVQVEAGRNWVRAVEFDQ